MPRLRLASLARPSRARAQSYFNQVAIGDLAAQAAPERGGAGAQAAAPALPSLLAQPLAALTSSATFSVRAQPAARALLAPC